MTKKATEPPRRRWFFLAMTMLTTWEHKSLSMSEPEKITFTVLTFCLLVACSFLSSEVSSDALLSSRRYKVQSVEYHWWISLLL